MVENVAIRIELSGAQKSGGRLVALAKAMGVKCTGCGSSWDDERLEAERRKRPALVSCCPDRRMVEVFRVDEEAEAHGLSLADRLDEAAKSAGGLDGDPERAALLAEAAAVARHVIGCSVTDEDDDACGICASGFKAADLCATDIELGIVHAECIAGSPTVNLDTGDEVDGPIATFRYDSLPMPKSDGPTPEEIDEALVAPFGNDFAGMTEKQIAEEERCAQDVIDEHEPWLEACAARRRIIARLAAAT